MGNYVAANNAASTLVGAITASSTSLSVQVADAAKFPVVNNGGVGTDYSMLTLQDSANNIEIVKVTRHDSGSSSFTVLRAQEGTAARAWVTGDSVACRLTAGVVGDSFVAASSAGASAAAAASSSSAAQAAAATAVGTANTAKSTADAAAAAADTAQSSANNAVAVAYPVGSIYINASNSANPATLFGFGTWTAFGAGRVLVGFDSGNALFDAAEEIGGSYDAIAVTHAHTASSSSTFAGSSGTTAAMSANASHSHTYPRAVVGGGYLGGTSSFSIAASGSTDATNIDHTHSFTPAGSVSTSTTVGSAGSSGTNKNIQPYITVYMWKRTA